jgi:hypothetical protein
MRANKFNNICPDMCANLKLCAWICDEMLHSLIICYACSAMHSLQQQQHETQHCMYSTCRNTYRYSAAIASGDKYCVHPSRACMSTL